VAVVDRLLLFRGHLCIKVQLEPQNGGCQRQVVAIQRWSLAQTVSNNLLKSVSRIWAGNGGLVLGSSLFSILPQLPQKNDNQFKSDQISLKNNHLASLI